MLKKDEFPEDEDIVGIVAYQRYNKVKYSVGKEKFASFYLKMAIIHESQAAKNELTRLAKMHQDTGSYKIALEHYKKLYYYKPADLKITLNTMLYSAVENHGPEQIKFLIDSGANLATESTSDEYSTFLIGDYIYPDLLACMMPENTLLHVACYKDKPEIAKLLISSGVSIFGKNRFKKTPREVNPVCFDTAWLLMHNDAYNKALLLFFLPAHEIKLPADFIFFIADTLLEMQTMSACDILGISLQTYIDLTFQARDYLVLDAIKNKYMELLEEDENTSYISPKARYPESPTIKEVIVHAFKNINQFYSPSLKLIRKEDRTLRALKALNYVTQDNKLHDAAPWVFKEEFNLLYPSPSSPQGVFRL